MFIRNVLCIVTFDMEQSHQIASDEGRTDDKYSQGQWTGIIG